MTHRTKVILIVCAIVAIVLIPFLINWLVASDSPKWLLPIAGSGTAEAAWMGFWANYIGSIFAACVAFVVLYKTLKQNEIENIKNRNDAHAENVAIAKNQERQLRYEVARQHLFDVRNTLVDCYMALEQEKTNDLFWSLRQDEIEIDLLAQRNSIAEIVDDENRAYYKLELLFPKPERNDKVVRIMTDIRKYSVESHMCLSDLVWLAQYYSDPELDLTNQAEIDDSVHKRGENQIKFNRLQKEGYKTIDKIIIENKWFDFEVEKDSILNAWQSARNKVNGYLLSSLNELNEYQTARVEGIIIDE